MLVLITKTLRLAFIQPANVLNVARGPQTKEYIITGDAGKSSPAASLSMNTVDGGSSSRSLRKQYA